MEILKQVIDYFKQGILLHKHGLKFDSRIILYKGPFQHDMYISDIHVKEKGLSLECFNSEIKIYTRLENINKSHNFFYINYEENTSRMETINSTFV